MVNLAERGILTEQETRILQLSVFDQDGNLATNETATVNVSVNGGSPTSTTIQNGSFSYTLGSTKKAGQYTVTATTSNVTNSATVQVTPGPVDATTSIVTANKQSMTAGDSVTVSATPEDQYGNAIGDAVEPVPDLSPVAPKGKHEVIGLHTLKQDKFPLRQIR